MNTALPIYPYREALVEAVNNHQVVVVTAETGSGKSTQIPQYLYEAGYSSIVTQPRRVAASSVAERVAEEMGVELGALVGFRTAEEHKDSADTKILFCTDGLQMVRELTGRGAAKQVLMIDEVHEWNRNMEVLVAWVKHTMSQGRNLKVVLASATIEAEKLADYFGTTAVISIPGALFPVKEEPAPGIPAWEVAGKLALKGHNVLAFFPGKAEIEDAATYLEKTEVGHSAVILPLHGQLPHHEQRKAFAHYSKPKIVLATNVAQTSITIDDIDAVVDTGEEKRIEVRDGVEGLYLGEISRADCIQRKGRAGRTKPGIYSLCGTPLELRDEFPTPEILRSRLDQMVLRLAKIGLDATELEFFHQPPLETLIESREALMRLGAMNQDGTVTAVGHQMAELPVNVHDAKSLVKSKVYGVESDMITIVACKEAGGIRGKGKKEGALTFPPKWLELTKEQESDLLAELELFYACQGKSNSELYYLDIIPKHYRKAEEIRERLSEQLNVPLADAPGSDREGILRSVASGMVDHVYKHQWDRNYVNGDKEDVRQIDMNSVVRFADWVTGQPFDLEVKSKKGGVFTLNLLTFVSSVKIEWLLEDAPHLITEEEVGFVYHIGTEDIAFKRSTLFNGQPVKELFEEPWEDPRATLALAMALAEGKVNFPDRYQNEEVARQVARVARNHENVPNLAKAAVLAEAYLPKLGNCFSTKEVASLELRFEVEDFVPEELLSEAGIVRPEMFSADGIELEVVFSQVNWGTTEIKVKEADLAKLTQLPQELIARSYWHTVMVVGENGNVIAEGRDLAKAKEELRKYQLRLQKRAEAEQARSALSELRQELARLQQAGRPINHLDSLLSAASSLIYRLDLSWRQSTIGEVEQALRAAKAEVERLDVGGTEVFVQDLLEGRLQHPDMALNAEVVRWVNECSIRTGGFIEPINKESLEAHYTKRLQNANSVQEVRECNLKLNAEDYAPEEFLEELKSEMAPETVTLEGAKKAQTYPLRYQFVEQKGETFPAAILTIPLSTYERNSWDYGKPSKFPVLPHGIRLILELTVQDEVVLVGEDGEQLVGKVKKFRKGKDRAKFAEGGTPEYGYGFSGTYGPIYPIH